MSINRTEDQSTNKSVGRGGEDVGSGLVDVVVGRGDLRFLFLFNMLKLP